MYIFSRTTLAALGKAPEAFPAAVGIAATVGEITGHEIRVFTAHFGAPLGTVMWSTTVESHADRATMLEKLAADQRYLDQADSMQGLFMTPATDGMSRFLSPPIDPNSRYYSITRAAMSNGKYAEGITFGIEMADYVSKEAGLPSVFVKPSFGGFADVTWISGMDSLGDVDQFEDWQMGDAGYQERVNSAADLFVENSGVNSLVEKSN